MKRELSIALSMLMVSMIHPILSVMVGLSIKSTSQFISFIWPKKCKVKNSIWTRLSTFSINVYLSIVGLLIFYLIHMDVSLGKEYQYKDQSYDKCLCDKLKKWSDPCTNDENDDFQNKFVNFPIKNFVLSFSIVSLACHVLHSLFVCIPSPVRMSDFILASVKISDTKGQETVESHEMTSFDSKPSSTPEPKAEVSKCNLGWTIFLKFICILMTMAVIGFLIAVPYLNISFGKSTSINPSGCPTKSNERCTFPFAFKDVTYYGCSKVDNSKIDFHAEGNGSVTAWCAIDAKENGEGAKSYEICADNCPGGKFYHILFYACNV